MMRNEDNFLGNIMTNTVDVAVIGAGHAGVEAALAAARLGVFVVCFSVNLDAVGNMPCNPAIGGTAKGQLVRELDALGGEMGKAADKACIQYRLLNRAKGPAVRSLRAQADRNRYREVIKHTLELEPNLMLVQAEIVSLEALPDGGFTLITATGTKWQCKAVVIASGTYLNGKTIIGEHTRISGPDGLQAAIGLSDSILAFGHSLRRFKTGTPPRINARSVDFSKMEIQRGDDDGLRFSFETETPPENRAVCWLTYTTAETHEILRSNLHRSPLYSGAIEGIGPRYCPSIEDKVVRFTDKARHQLFIEPLGMNTEEMYVQGFSSSMPEDVQIDALRSVIGLEHAEITRPAYAIEYDCIDPTEFTLTLESKLCPGLYGAGQFCGSSGYEEAAVQGFLAGANAALKLLRKPPLILQRSDGYIGVLIDDLVTKGTNEPYRMMTSRDEFRLLHRGNNADRRLREKGIAAEIVKEQTRKKLAAIDGEAERLERTHVPPGTSLASLLRRPEYDYASLAELDTERPELSADVIEEVETIIKYAGYISRQQREAEEFTRLENRLLPEDIDYNAMTTLRLEARQKLSKLRPISFGQAARISGVSPSDIAALMIAVRK
jgi:tRNA uridine 5-carboxymethylaminomethyl modification enzyme